MVATVTHSVVFQLGVMKINASSGALKYEHGTRVLLAKEFTSAISNKIFVAVSIHIVILYSPIGGYEGFIRIQCLCLQGQSQMGEDVVTLYRQGNMCGSLTTWNEVSPSHVLSDLAMLLCLIHDVNTYSPFLLQP